MRPHLYIARSSHHTLAISLSLGYSGVFCFRTLHKYLSAKDLAKAVFFQSLDSKSITGVGLAKLVPDNLVSRSKYCLIPVYIAAKDK